MATVRWSLWVLPPLFHHSFCAPWRIIVPVNQPRATAACYVKNHHLKTSSKSATPFFIPLLPNHAVLSISTAVPPPLDLTSDRPSTAILSTPSSHHHPPPTFPINSQLPGCANEWMRFFSYDHRRPMIPRARVRQWLWRKIKGAIALLYIISYPFWTTPAHYIRSP